MADPSAALEDAAEEAANDVISAHGIAVEGDESCFEALCWALGTGVLSPMRRACSSSPRLSSTALT